MTDVPAADGPLRLAVVILADRATDADRERLDGMVATARALGADPIVVALRRGGRAPAQARVVHVAPGAAWIAAVRAGMAQLSNTTSRYALLWPLDAAAASVAGMRALLDDVARDRPLLAARVGDDLERAHVVIAREAWLDLITIGEQGMDAVAARLGVRRSPR